MSICLRKILFLAIAVQVVILLFFPEARAQNTKNVLILNSYHQGYKWTDDETQGAIAGLDPDRNDLKIFIEYMGTKWAFEDPYFAQLSEMFNYKFRKFRFDMIIATDDDAFNFLKRYRDELFPNTPVVFCGVNWFKPESVPSGFKGYTGVNEDADIPATLDLMLKLHPGAKKVYVVNDITTTGKEIHAEFEGIIPKYKDKVSFTFLENMNMSEILDTVGKLGSDSLVLITLFQQDKAGTFFEFDESTRLISKSSRVPVYGLWDFDLGFGIVGGMLTSGFAQGKTAGEMALRILKGENADAIPVLMKSPNRFMFDYLQMQRFGVRNSDLPPGSTVINKPASFYDLHKGLAWGVVTGFLALTTIILLLLVNIRQRKEGEKALRESEEKVRTLLTNINVGVARSTWDGRFIQVNPAMAKIFGYETTELLMKTPAIDLYQDPEDRQRFLTQLKSKESVKNIEIAMEKKDGTPIWASFNVTPQYNNHGTIKYLDVVLEDVTQRRLAKEALQKAHDELEMRVRERTADLTSSNEQLQTEIAERQRIQQQLERWNLILSTEQETSLDGIIVVDESNTIVSHNRRLIEMWGIPPELVEAREDMPLWRLLTSLIADTEEFAKKIICLYENKGEKSHGEIILKDERVFEHYSSPMISAAGTYFGRIWYFRDITDRKKMQEEIIKAQKLESLGVLAGG
ncbi:MAG TPA: ABC transporter substrate binding protein, partial [Nitrospirota bacterium]|nr:ABC transporter substrate binding protein [Nitrospirota bacterium]